MKNNRIDFTILSVGVETFRQARIEYCPKCGLRGEMAEFGGGRRYIHRTAKNKVEGVVFYSDTDSCFLTTAEIADMTRFDADLADFIKLDMPAPPMIEAALAYDERPQSDFYPHCRFVAFFWWGSKLAFADGQITANTAYRAWLILTSHPVFFPIRLAWNFGSDDEPAQDYLLIDRVSRAMYVGPADPVEEFLIKHQGPRWPALSEDEITVIAGDVLEQIKTVSCAQGEVNQETIKRVRAAIEQECALIEQLHRWLDDYHLRMGYEAAARLMVTADFARGGSVLPS